MDLRAPARPLARTERNAWLWSVAIVTTLALAGGIAFLHFRGAIERPRNPDIADVKPSEPGTVAYVYRCANGDVQLSPCVEGPASSVSPSSRSTFNTYRAPRLEDDPTGRRLMADADARYRREVQAARIGSSPYEETVALTQSAECREIREKREQIRIGMRRGYDVPLGEQYRRRDYSLWQARHPSRLLDRIEAWLIDNASPRNGW